MPDAPIRHPVKILFLDVDGTMTNGVIGFTHLGDYRSFWVKDGLALEWARDAGILPVIISGRPSAAVEARMKDLKLEYYLGEKDKVVVAERVIAREGVRWDECVMVGDDLPDVPLFNRCGFAAAVPHAPAAVRARAHYVTERAGGKGAVREVCELILASQGLLQPLLAAYGA